MKKRKLEEEENPEVKEPEEGECTGSENDDISDENTPDISTNSESEHEEEQGLLLIYFYLSILFFILSRYFSVYLL